MSTGVTQHIRRLCEKYDWTYEAIASVSGVPPRRVRHWASGRMGVGASKVLEIPLRRMRSELVLVHSIGSTRRLQDLCLRGFTVEAVEELTGIDGATLLSIRSGHTTEVSIKVADEVRRAHAAMMLLPEPVNEKVTATAKRRGFLPIGVWDDVDDPECKPDSTAPPEVEESMSKLRQMYARGFTIKELAERVRLNQSNLLDIMYGKNQAVRKPTVEKIRRLFDEVSKLPDPEGFYADRNRRLSQERGWV